MMCFRFFYCHLFYEYITHYVSLIQIKLEERVRFDEQNQINS
jgi:hypothetical protein